MLDLDYGRDQGQGGVRIRSVWEGVVEVKPGGKGVGVALCRVDHGSLLMCKFSTPPAHFPNLNEPQEFGHSLIPAKTPQSSPVHSDDYTIFRQG